MNTKSILSTKILLSHQKKALLNAGFLVSEANFIQTTPLDFKFSEEFSEIDGIIFTSQNAIQSVLSHAKLEEIKTKKIYCVGVKSKEILRENGFNVEVYADYASDLAEIISLIYAREKFIFFSGNLRMETLPKMLNQANVVFKEVPVYKTELTPHKISLLNDFKNQKKQFDGILFFSPSAVESYLLQNKIKNEMCFCIGETTAKSLQKTTKNILIANQPSIENLIEDIVEQFAL